MVTTKNRWWLYGLFWGTFMFLFQQVLWPISQGDPLTFKRLLFGFFYWQIGGLVYGWIMALIESRRKPTGDKSSGSGS